MYAEERQQAIATLVGQRGRVSVTDLSEQYGVTTETVRRDLAALDRMGLIRRVHGGAVPAAALTAIELGTGEREHSHAAEKDRIAKAALEFLPPTGGSVLFDAGTTTARVAALLPTDRELVAVTTWSRSQPGSAGTPRCGCICSEGASAASPRLPSDRKPSACSASCASTSRSSGPTR